MTQGQFDQIAFRDHLFHAMLEIDPVARAVKIIESGEASSFQILPEVTSRLWCDIPGSRLTEIEERILQEFRIFQLYDLIGFRRGLNACYLSKDFQQVALGPWIILSPTGIPASVEIGTELDPSGSEVNRIQRIGIKVQEQTIR